MKKKYILAWLDLKHYISLKYGYSNNEEALRVLKDILEYMQKLEYDINKKEDK